MTVPSSGLKVSFREGWNCLDPTPEKYWCNDNATKDDYTPLKTNLNYKFTPDIGEPYTNVCL